MKSLTQRVLELKEKYLQLDNFMPKIKQTIVTTIALTTILKYIVMPVAASEPLNVKEYIKQNNYNLPSIFQLYLNPLNENGLDENEKKAIDIIANAPEEKQDEGKALAKEIYNNKGLTPEILTKLENLNLPEKQEQVNGFNGLEEKVTQKPENPVDIYAVIADGDYYKEDSYQTTCMIMFYELLRKNGVNDANINLLMVNPHNEDFTNAKSYEEYKKGSLSKYLPSNKEQIEVDDNNITLKKFLNAVSKIPSDNNDLVYIFYAGHGSEKGEFQFQGGYLDSKLLVKNIKKIDYGELIIMQESCYAENLVGNLKAIDNYITIAASGKNEIANAGILSYMLVKYYNKNPNTSIKQLIDNSNKELLRVGYSQFKLFCSNENHCNEPLIPANY